MTAAYPAALPSFTAKTDSVDDVMAADVNGAYDEIVAIGTELGVDVAGTATDLVTRLAQGLDGAGNINFAAASTLTLSGGAITTTQNYHRVDTESSAASDDLDTITAAAGGFVLVLRPVADARNVVIRHNIGNILCAGGTNITLDLYTDMVILIYDAVVSKWLAIGITAAALLNRANTFLKEVAFNNAVSYLVTALTDSATLDSTHSIVTVDATAGAKTITLPSAAICVGRRYDIKKIDSSANAVTIDGDGSETIDGATTKALSAQWAALTIISDGTNWIIL